MSSGMSVPIERVFPEGENSYLPAWLGFMEGGYLSRQYCCLLVAAHSHGPALADLVYINGSSHAKIGLAAAASLSPSSSSRLVSAILLAIILC